MNTNNYLKHAIYMAQKAGEALMKDFKKTDPVSRSTAKEIKTRFDLNADKIIKTEIEKTFPNHSYLTEETGLVQKDSDFLWIIDPLDGTRNFVNGNPFFAVSIALWIKGEPYCGVIEAPAIHERYIAEKGEGAFMIDLKTNKQERVKVSTVQDIASSYVVFCDGGTKNSNRVMKFLKQIYPFAKDMRKMGSAAIECAWVGTGRADAYITPDISLWDIAAGVLFVKEAGGRVMDFAIKELKFPDLAKAKQINLVTANKKIDIKPISF